MRSAVSTTYRRPSAGEHRGSSIAIAISTATWVFSGLASLPGPAAGTTAFAVTRAAFGRNGGRPISAFNWIMQIGYEVLDLVLLVLAVTTLLGMAGVNAGRPLEVALILVFAVAQSLLPLVGHAAITRALHALVVPFAVVFIILAWLTASRLHLHDSVPGGWAAFLGGIALACSGGIPQALQAIGLRISRWQAVALDGAICAAVTVAVVFFGSFDTYLSDFLLFMIVWFAPWTAILVTDFFLRGGRYDVVSLDSRPGGRYLRPGGVHLSGVIAQAAGMAASALWISTSVFTGPLSRAGNGIDLSVPAGLIVGGLVYWVLSARTVPAETAGIPRPLLSPSAAPLPEEA